MCKLPDRHKQVGYCRILLQKQPLSERFENGSKKTEYEKLFSKQICLLSSIELFSQRFIVLDETAVHK